MNRAVVFIYLLMFVCISSNAATVVFDPASTTSLRVVNRIEGLDINVTGFTGTYDVIFTSESFDDVQAAGGHPIYDQYMGAPTTGLTVADGVVDEIVAILNTTDANKVGRIEAGTIGTNSGFLYLPYAPGTLTDHVLASRGRYVSTPLWETLTASPGSIDSTVTNGFVYASLIPSVPIPAAFWLFGSGLLGLVGIARRKKA
jgi:hypothetical protein